MTRKQAAVRLIAASVAVSLLTYVAVGVATAAGGPNLSLGKATSASSTNGGFVTGNLNDGNQNSYWESTNNSFPQWAQVDLGSVHQHRPGGAQAAQRAGAPAPRHCPCRAVSTTSASPRS